MSDIIKDAKQLLDGATPAPWELSETEVTHRLLGGEVYEYGGEPLLVIGGGPEEATPIEHEDAEDEPPYFYLIQHYADGELMAAAPDLAQALAEETWEYQVQTRSQRMPTWSAITDDTLQKWYPEDKYNDLTHTGRIVRGGAGFEIRVLRRRVSPVEVINE